MSSSPGFTATLLRASARCFAAMAVGKVFENEPDGTASAGGFELWLRHLEGLVLELAAAVDDGGKEHFAAKVAWAREAFETRGLDAGRLRSGIDELRAVLEESLDDEAAKPLKDYFEAARQELERSQQARPADEPPAPGSLEELALAYLADIRDGDASSAIRRVVGAIEDGRAEVPEVLNVAIPRALEEIGRLWHSGALNVAEEHFASLTTGRLIERVVLAAPQPEPLGRKVILTMAEGDAHDLGIRLVAALFELDGWHTICLGANTPAADFVIATRNFDADLAVIGATLNTQREAVARTIAALRQVRPGQRILVGGSAFHDLERRAQELGANACVRDSREAVRAGRALLES